LLSLYLPEKTRTTAREYIDLLFDESLDEELIADLNPMDQLEFSFTDHNANTFSKFLTFKVKRIYNDEDKIEGLIITVIDETEEYLLSKQLEETESRSKKQIEWLMGILHVDSNLLYEFMNTTFSELDYIEKLLKADNGDPSEYHTILDNIARSLHLIKGNANLLDLKFFAQQVHNIEEKAVEIQNTKQLDGSDFLPLVMQLNGLRNTLNELNSLIERISQFNAHKKEKSETPALEVSFLDTAENLINRMAKDLKKQVKFEHNDFKLELIPPQYKLLIKNIITQLSRNSLAHGIETVEERKAFGKTIPAKIKINNQVKENEYLMQFYDDGRGLQLQKLKEKALESEKWSHKEINSWDRQALAEVIFTPGISSASSSDLFSGRGIGMDLIRDQLKKHQGKIEVDFKESEYCLFTISLPLVSKN
jgi:chemotaxis protein histidine kinase CheA